jgi:uncharacterized repeat protein (TIGR01451 family)
VDLPKPFFTHSFLSPACALIALAGLLGSTASAAPPAPTATITAQQINGLSGDASSFWVFDTFDTNGSGVLPDPTLSLAPPPALLTGYADSAARLSTGPGTGGSGCTRLGGKAFLGTRALHGTRLSELTALGYSHLVDSNSGVPAAAFLTPYVSIYVDNNGDGVWSGSSDSILVYEPFYTLGAPTLDVWYDNQAIGSGANGRWHYAGQPLPGMGLFIPNTVDLWAEVIAQPVGGAGFDPTATTIGDLRIVNPAPGCVGSAQGGTGVEGTGNGLSITVGQKSGSPWNDFVAFVDAAYLTVTGTNATSFVHNFNACGALVVTNNNDSGAGSLRQVIADACTGSTITFDPALSGQTIVLASELVINKSLTIQGNVPITVSGNDVVRVFNLTAGNITLSDLTIANGRATPGAGIRVSISATLTLINSTVRDNVSTNLGGGIYSTSPDANCTGTPSVTIHNSTISGNSATVASGGIRNLNGLMEITNSTITNNTAQIAGGVASFNDVLTCTRIGNTIVSGNSGGDVAASGTDQRFFSLGNNLVGTAGANVNFALEFNQPGDQVNVSNPLVAALGNYGGTTQTHALLPGSPALNAGNNAGAPATDQRGIARPQQDTVDIGAYESRGFVLSTVSGTPQSAVINTAFAAPLVVGVVANQVIEPVDGGQVSFTAPGAGASASLASNPATIAGGQASVIAMANATIGAYNVTAAAGGATGAPSFALTNLPDCTNNPIAANGNDAGAGSLRQAIIDACPGSTITFAGGVTSVGLTTAQLLINKNLIIDGGAGVTVTRLAGSPDFRIVGVAPGNTATLDSLTMTNGRANVGGVILNQGNLTILDAVISGGLASADGGGVYSQDGVLHISNSTISGNTAANIAGGIINVGFSTAASATIINTSIVDNRAAFTGGMANQGGALIMTNSTIADNEATDGDPTGDGGGLTNIGVAFDTTATLVNCTFDGNRQLSAVSPTADDVYSGNFGNQSTVTLKNTILGGSTATATPNLRTFAGGIITSLGNNLSSDAGAGVLTGPGDLINTNPLLAALGNYGGSTPTHALLPGSAAINAGNNTGAPVTDQRGIARPQLGTVDIGAFESRGFTLALTGGNNQSTGPGLAFATPLTATVAAIAPGEPVQGGLVTFTQPGAGASAILAPNPASIGAGGVVSSVATANATSGTYVVAASANGATPSLSYTLTNAGADLSIDDVTIIEGDAGFSSATFTVERSNNLTAFSVPYSITAGTAQAGSDYTPTSGTLTFTVGGALTQTINVPVVGDLIVEDTETATLNLGVVTNTVGVTKVTDGSGVLTINDNDSAVVAFNPIDVSQSEATSPMVFTVTLSNPVQSGVTLVLDSAFGTATAADFTPIVGGTVRFAPNSNASQTVNVAITNDALNEDDESFTLELSGLTADGNVTLGASVATGTIVDDDPSPTLSISSPSQPEGNSGTTSMDFVVSLSTVSGRDVMFTRATQDGTATVANGDYVPLPAAQATIPAGELSISIPVLTNGDTTFEGDESFSLDITDVVNATPTSLSGIGTIEDDDQQPTTTTIGNLPDPSLVGQPYTVSVTVSAQTLSPLGTVMVSDGSDSCGPISLSPGTAPDSSGSCELTSNSAGAKLLTASYTPATDAFAESSGTENHQVDPASTSISVSGPADSRVDQPISFGFALDVVTPGGGTPSGTVTLSTTGSSCQVIVPSATAACDLQFGTLGPATVSASYTPDDGDHLASTGSGAGNAQTLVFALADLQLTKTAVVGNYLDGDLLVYTVTLRNLGEDTAVDLRLSDVVPAGLVDVLWTCDSSGGLSCPQSNGSGELDEAIPVFPVGGLLNYSFYGNVDGNPSQIVNTASVSLPADGRVQDPDLANNSATVVSLNQLIFADGFEASLVSALNGSYTLPVDGLRSLLDEVGRILFVLDDANGHAARVYARVHAGQLQYALAERDAAGKLRLGIWQTISGDPKISWTARESARGWVVESVELR